MGKIFDPHLIIEYLPYILKGLSTSLILFVSVISLSFVFGTLGALIKLKKIPVLYQFTILIGSYAMNIPTIVQCIALRNSCFYSGKIGFNDRGNQSGFAQC